MKLALFRSKGTEPETEASIYSAFFLRVCFDHHLGRTRKTRLESRYFLEGKMTYKVTIA